MPQSAGSSDVVDAEGGRRASSYAAMRGGRQIAGALERRFDALLERIARLDPEQLSTLPHARWVLDNSHLARQALQQIRSDLPAGFRRHLPHQPERKTVPRVFDIISTFLERTGLPLDIDALTQSCTDRLENFNQQGLPAHLNLGELWSVPTVLRILLIDRLCAAAEVLSAESEQLAGSPGSIQVTQIAGCVASLRGVAAADWRIFIERSSAIELTLNSDPAGVYAGMDFPTRDRYRRTVEALARRSPMDQAEVAQTAIELAARAAPREAGNEPAARPAVNAHVGYYLVDVGRAELERAIAYRTPLRSRLVPDRALLRSGAYLLAITGLAALGVVALVRYLFDSAVSPSVLLLTSLLTFCVLISISAGIGNFVLSLLVPPRRLPKLDFSQGIRTDQRTIVVVPILLASAEELADILSILEQNYLGNADPNLHFALLSDFVDAPSASTKDDAALLQQACDGIDHLNDLYASKQPACFSLFHRRRLWNSNANCWMGWERKRGKLEEFNDLLRGVTDTSYSITHATENLDFASIRNLITLDADSYLPTGAAARLVGTLAHPLNQPEFESATNQLMRGYTIIQPRLETNPVTGANNLFTRIFAGDITLDLYTHATSEVYQDLFADAIFAGKGIYNIDAFRTNVHNKIRQNQILSHDLLEGLFGRTGLATDIILLENFPPTYLAWLKRLHRWIRGDWQLLTWLFRRSAIGPTPASAAPLWRGSELLRRWKILENLRRSLVLPAIAALLLLGWTVLPGSPLWWTLLFSLLPGLPIVFRLVLALRSSQWRWGTVRSSVHNLATHAGADAARWLLALAFLPAEVWVSLDAAIRSSYRQLVSKRHLLEWTTAAEAARAAPVNLARSGHYWRALWMAPTSAVLSCGLIVLAQPEALAIAWPLLLAWAAAPWLGFRLAALKPERRHPPLTATDLLLLRTLARDTWRFFERFVGPETGWLPPDNVQEYPRRVVAERTSPTNIGMLLLSTVAAWDLGYLSREELLRRLENHLHAIEQLPKHRGHLLNWYSTRDLAALEPRYVSTVDSGNLVAAYMTTANALKKISATDADQQPRERALRKALRDDLRALQRDLSVASLSPSASVAPTDALTESLQVALLELDCANSLHAAATRLREHHAPAIDQAVLGALDERPDLFGAEEIARYREHSQSLRQRLRHILQEQRTQTPDSPSDQAGEAQVHQLVRRIDALIEQTDFTFLYNPNRDLFRIGFNVSTGEADDSYYDLLASEARIASLVAIAKRDVPARHWTHLGRPLTRLRGLRVLLSWSATAFEYLMPRLLVRSPRSGLIDQSCEGAVREQIRFGRRHGIPWGISESGYAQFDTHNNYQYFAFGIPRLGLKWDQGERLVTSSYASVLALPYAPAETLDNIRKLQAMGGAGQFGLYEALDFGDARHAQTAHPRVVQSYMAHHQGMILVAINNALHDDIMLDRFHADPRIASVEHLLHERLPERLHTRTLERLPAPLKETTPPRAAVVQWPVSRDEQELAVLSNGRLSSWLSSEGAGGLNWRGLTAARCNPLTEGPLGGSRTYLQDLADGRIFNLGLTPRDRRTETLFAPHMAEYRAHGNDLMLRLSVAIDPEVDVEVRRITLSNNASVIRRLQLTSYCEPVLDTAAADRRHPAFSKLFVEGQPLSDGRTLLFTRSSKEPHQPALYLAHSVLGDHHLVDVQLESDRKAFFGRCADPAQPHRLTGAQQQGPTAHTSSLDACAALIATVEVPAHTTVQLAFLTSVGDNRQTTLRHLHTINSLDRATWSQEAARLFSEEELTVQRLNSGQVRMAYALAAKLYWPRTLAHLPHFDFEHIHRVQDVLWRHAISGDRPVLGMIINYETDVVRAESLLQQVSLLSRKGLFLDLMFLEESRGGYTQPVDDELRQAIDKHLPQGREHNGSRAYVIAGRALGTGERERLLAAARLLIEPVDALEPAPIHTLPALVPQPSAPLDHTRIDPVTLPDDLRWPNAHGGMQPNGRGYILRIDTQHPTPTPWCNVLANPQFGTLVSESGSMCSWWQNSSERRLSPWNNDPVLDRGGEAVYLRDEETGEHWSMTPQPRPAATTYRVSHLTGETRFEHNFCGLESRLQVCVDTELPLKFLRVRLRNRWPRQRRLTATYAVEWLLGNTHNFGRHLLCTEQHAQSSALLVRDSYARDAGEEWHFLGASLSPHGVTSSGDEFLGSRRSWSNPAGLIAVGLSNTLAPSAQPLGAYQVHLDIAPDETIEFHFVLGAAADRATLDALLEGALRGDAADTALEKQVRQWNKLLGGVSVTTPNPALDAMVNRWLLYQVLSSRLWGRMGFYQSSGGFGFRDQLQDSLALLDTAPELTREQILYSATRQFESGDVLHWWHDHPLRGVRTRISDDLLWLPYAVADYVETTNDATLLDARAPFLQGASLDATELERYAEYTEAPTAASIYEHCCRAIDARLTLGAHGLPFIGTGDWNDGLNRVGERGQGESLWMAWFLVVVCQRFTVICNERGDHDRASNYRRVARDLREHTREQGWTGAWYLRGYFDDGTALGAPGASECEIDLNAQTWSVFADPQHPQSQQALDSAEALLLDSGHRLIKLLAPPFQRMQPNPGYISAYPRGVRENGGQYTHAAVWAPWAATLQGDAERALRWFDWLNPLQRPGDSASINHYGLEPWVMPGDVYAGGLHDGRGGWSWYTGSAAWMYRLAVNRLLGLQRRGERLYIRPCLPASWPSYSAKVQLGTHRLHLRVHEPARVAADHLYLLRDGKELQSDSLPIDGGETTHWEVFPDDSSRRQWLLDAEGGTVGVDA